MKTLKFGAICLILLASNVYAQDVKVIITPDIGQEVTVPAGGDIYSISHIISVDGVELAEPAKAGSWMLESLYPAGTKLVPSSLTKAKLKACVPQKNTLEPSGPCFIDDDGDGLFDRRAGDEMEVARKFKTPVAYSPTTVSITGEKSFKQVILFQGATTDSLRFSYREFKNDMARPAFTEELTIPRETFPAMIMVKNIQLEILGVSGMGLKYRLVKVN